MFARARRKAGAHGRRYTKLGIGALFLSLSFSAAQAACTDTSLIVKSDTAQARFNVEVAETRAERNQGLMFREVMAQSAGMLFVFEAPQRVSFWMRNTLIPLDMLFMAADGTVTRIHENAVPLDETPIPGGDQVQFVLEINGGLARQLGLDVGAVVQHPAIPQEIAAFPCE